MNDTEERSICVRENEILTDIYRCKICSTRVKRDRMDIEAHLKQAHKTTLKVYGANFENPSNQDSLEATVSKLVREGKMEDPTKMKNMNLTPKKIKSTQSVVNREIINKVPENENLNKFVSVSENVTEEQEDQAVIKSEIEIKESLEKSLSSLVAGSECEKQSRLRLKRKRHLQEKQLRSGLISKPGLSPMSLARNADSVNVVKTDPDGPGSSEGR